VHWRTIVWPHKVTALLARAERQGLSERATEDAP
jgi:hypothetical protein